jgi:hypothetical protein
MSGKSKLLHFKPIQPARASYFPFSGKDAAAAFRDGEIRRSD